VDTALQRHGVAIPDRSTTDAMLNVFLAIRDADERGQFGRRTKRLSAEAAEWCGWNLSLKKSDTMNSRARLGIDRRTKNLSFQTGNLIVLPATGSRVAHG